MRTHIIIEGQVPDSPDPNYVTDTYAEGHLEFITDVNNYNDRVVMVRISPGGVLLVDASELRRALEMLGSGVDDASP
mgnify:CR=1 FL=1